MGGDWGGGEFLPKRERDIKAPVKAAMKTQKESSNEADASEGDQAEAQGHREDHETAQLRRQPL